MAVNFLFRLKVIREGIHTIAERPNTSIVYLFV